MGMKTDLHTERRRLEGEEVGDEKKEVFTQAMLVFGYLQAFGPGSSGNVPPQGGMANIQEGQERRKGRSTTARKSQTVSFFGDRGGQNLPIYLPL